MTTTFIQLYQALQGEADPWQAVQSIQAYVTRALAWAFADRLEATGSFQHTFLPDFFVHLQPGPRLAIHMRFNSVSALALATSLTRKRKDDYKHLILVKSLPETHVADEKVAEIYRKKGILVTSFDLIDQIMRVVTLVEEHGPYHTTLKLRGLQRRLEQWCLGSYGWRPAPSLEDFIGRAPIRSRTPVLDASPVTAWVREKEGDDTFQFLQDSTSLGIRRLQKRDLTDVGPAASFDKVRRIAEVAQPSILLTRTNSGVSEPTIACTISRHAPMGQNAYQVLPQAIACAEAGTPFVLVAPERAAVERTDGKVTVEQAHPLLYQALTRMMHIYRVPVLMLPWPVDDDAYGVPVLRDDARYPSMPDRASSAVQLLFRCIDFVLESGSNEATVENLLGYHGVVRRRIEMEESRFRLGTRAIEDPPRNSGILLPTKDIKDYIHKPLGITQIRLSRRIERRPTTLVMTTGSRTLRTAPYLGTLLAFDFAFCRIGPKPRDRSSNLFAHFREVSIDDAVPKLFEDNSLDRPRSNQLALFLQYTDALLFQDGLITRIDDEWVSYRP